MRTRSSKGDATQNALRVVEQAIGAPLKPESKKVQFPPRKKNPAAVAWVSSAACRENTLGQRLTVLGLREPTFSPHFQNSPIH